MPKGGAHAGGGDASKGGAAASQHDHCSSSSSSLLRQSAEEEEEEEEEGSSNSKLAFGPILDLIPLAESVIKLSAVCMLCHREAAFSKRIGSETEIEVIGGADKYIAVCRECYHSDGKKRNGKKKQQQQQQQQSGDTTCVQGTKSEDMHARVNDSLESTTTESEGGDADDEHTHDDGSESDSASSDGFSGTASPTDATPSKKKEFHPRSTRSLFTATRN
ncbi:thymidine kinase [Salpingoeca rosetta]|uniref:Thymidine kinase n=1 Tax=Salpingoeca rosetta (strain ATCC 50818 / BSB-021) TaxID=946362 RepID=F2UGK0_SALR5|nr:thymidine kinase [Salpingoeca rosetta]EGD75750.1 thymidine kinase [Salpingoeca rosetta]|eukprot:XP_004991671.1 thymidine kinase [Salpingoeca rosetta]